MRGQYGNYIKHHNNRILARSNKSTNSKLIESVMYEAKEESNGKMMNYYGLTEGRFKARYRNHIKTFSNPIYGSITKLCELIWLPKEQGKRFSIKGCMTAKSKPCRCYSRRCGLCTTKKLIHNAKTNPTTCINKRNEIMSKCSVEENSILLISRPY